MFGISETPARNLEIGMQRAQAVSEYLQNKGIESNRLHLFSKGQNEPLVQIFRQKTNQ